MVTVRSAPQPRLSRYLELEDDASAMIIVFSFFCFLFQDPQEQPDPTYWLASGSVVDHRVQDFANLGETETAWVASCNKTNARPVIASDKIILLERLNAKEERVRCLRLTTGQTLWEHSYLAPLPVNFDGEFGWGPHSTPAIHRSRVVTIGTTGHTWVLELDDGTAVWHRELWSDFPNATRLERGIAASPLIEADQVIIPVGGRGSGVVALSIANGQTTWSSTDFESAYTSPIVGQVGGRRQVIVLMSDVLCGLDSLTGQLLWQTSFKTVNSVHVASPIIVGPQSILAGSSDSSRLFQLALDRDRYQINEAWRSKRCTPQVGNYLQFGRQVIAPASGSSTNFTACLDLKDGTLVWKERFGGRGCLVELRDGFLTLNERGDLSVRQIDSSNTREVIQLLNFAEPPQWSAPSFSSGYMVLQVSDELRAWKLR